MSDEKENNPSSNINVEPATAVLDSAKAFQVSISDVQSKLNDGHISPSLSSNQLASGECPEPTMKDDLDLALHVPNQNWTLKDFQKLKVAELKEELQSRNSATSGLKEELINRLLLSYCKDNCLVGRDVLPKMGMRVRHVNGPNHGSSKGMGGVIEYIPGRGAFRSDEKSVSVRWDADKSDVRGPYYAGEPCDRGSGVGTPKFDLLCLDPNPERIRTHLFASDHVNCPNVRGVATIDNSQDLGEEVSGLQEEESSKSPVPRDCDQRICNVIDSVDSMYSEKVLDSVPSSMENIAASAPVTCIDRCDVSSKMSTDSRKRSYEG